MKQVLYPAIFHNENDKYWVEFPDLEGCFSEGDTLEEAYIMAQDALYCYLQELNGKYPEETPLNSIKATGEDVVLLVSPNPYLSEKAKNYLVQEAIEKGLKERRLNENQAAIILGVDRSYMTYIISGKKSPSPDMAKRIALLLGFDWALFFENAEVS